MSVNAINGLGSAYTKSINGLANASVKSINGASLSDILLYFADATFTNASPRYLLDPLNKQVLGPFAGGTLATTTYEDRIYAQIEEARTQLFTNPQDMSHGDWTLDRMETPTAAIDPLGGNTAWKIMPNTASNFHRIYQTKTPDGSSQYTLSALLKAGEYGWALLTMTTEGFTNVPTCYFNLTGGTKGTPGNVDASDMVDYGGGWYLCSITATSDAVAATKIRVCSAEDDNDASYAGDGTSGFYCWNPQFELGATPSSPMAAAGARAKDQLYWGSALVPAAIKGGTWAAKIAPFFAHDESSAFNYVCANTTTSDHIRYRLSTAKFQVHDDNVNVISSDAVTFPRNQLMTLTMDAVAGSLITAGAASGNGPKVGAAWEWASEDFNYGMNMTEAQQLNGLICEPYRP